MTLCDYTDVHGSIPRNCLQLRAYLDALAEVLHTVNPIRCGSGVGVPSSATLTALWAPCDVPPGAIVTWYDTGSGDGAEWYCQDGSVVGCVWLRLSLFEYYTRILSISPLALWRLLEVGGAVAFDSTVNAYDGAYVGPTLNNDTSPDGQPCPTFDGINDNVNVFSAGLASVMDGVEGTFAGWCKVSGGGVWTDASARILFSFRAASDNDHVFIMKLGTGEILFNAALGGVTVSVTSAIQTTADWLHVAVTWSASGDEIELFLGGVSVGTDTVLGVWAGPILTAALGSLSHVSGNWWDGSLALAGVWDYVLSGPTITSLASI